MNKKKKNKQLSPASVPYEPLPQGLLSDIDFDMIESLENKVFQMEQIIVDQAKTIHELNKKINDSKIDKKYRMIYNRHGVQYDSFEVN